MHITNSLPKTKTIKIQDVEYIIKFPNIADIIDIETSKITFSNNKYGQLLLLPSSLKMIRIIDSLSFFSIMIPSLKEDLRVKNIFLLSANEVNNFINIYVKDIEPWYNEIFNLIKEAISDEEQDKINKDNEKKEIINN